MKPNIWIRQMTWATNYGIWIGKRRERKRVLSILKPHAEHDDWCVNGCYPEDCSAPLVQWLIQEILKTDLQDNVNNALHKEDNVQNNEHKRRRAKVSDINDLIAINARNAFAQGAKTERKRIVQILKSLPKEFSHNDYVLRVIAKAVSEINSQPK